MIVPRYWAEARIQHKRDGKQITVRRFGWSDASQAEAQSNAESRVKDALRRILSGERLDRREPKVPYHGASGTPIREEIIDRRADTVITRNSYGALCLNTPNVLFADIDFAFEPSGSLFFVCYVLFNAIIVWASWQMRSRMLLFVGAFVATWLAMMMPKLAWSIWQKFSGTPEVRARELVNRFVARHPEWNVRVYRTPAGLRLLVTHRLFDPNEVSVEQFFRSLRVDPIYALMYKNQQCFRARVSPKPWRVGMTAHLRPQPGVWPIHPERLPLRHAWVAEYQLKCRDHASCLFIESIGSGIVHHEVRPVVEWHDELCFATISGLPIA